LITQRVIEANPSLKERVSIEEHDERNIQINHYAKAMAFDFVQFLALPFFLLLVLADVSLWVVFLAIALYIVHFAVYLWFLNKKMQGE
jgi:Flp pilus assembly protein TadB